jgi:hypothetical protein
MVPGTLGKYNLKLGDHYPVTGAIAMFTPSALRTALMVS